MSNLLIEKNPICCRFLPGLFNIFNSCSRCNKGKDDRCCKSGHKRCCAQALVGFPQSGFVFHGFSRPGINGHQPGFIQPGFGTFHGGQKRGFCRRSSLFGGHFTESGAGGPQSGSGLISAIPDEESAVNAQEGNSTRHARQISFSGQEELSQTSVEGTPDELTPGVSDNQSDPANPDTRLFIPNPFGPGSLVPNIFCKDECFNDFDCTGHLKCCLRDCRKCEGPVGPFFF